MDKEDIYNLKLHESLYIEDGDITVLRVPGGWVYKTGQNQVFVPFIQSFVHDEQMNFNSFPL